MTDLRPSARELRIMIFEWVGKPAWNLYEWPMLEQKIVTLLEAIVQRRATRRNESKETIQ